MSSNNSASIFRIMLVDVIAGICAMMIFCIITVFLLDVTGLIDVKDNAYDLILFTLISMPLFGLPIILRAKYINKLITQGHEHKGSISNLVSGYNMAEGIWYEYTIDGILYKKYYPAMFYKCQLSIGDNVTVVVDANNYKRSAIKGLFI